MYRFHWVLSVLTTSVKILSYRPPAQLIRAKEQSGSISFNMALGHTTAHVLDCCLMSPWNDLYKLCDFGASDIQTDTKKPVLVDQVQPMPCEIDEGDVWGHLTFTELLLELTKGTDHVHC